MSSYVRRNCFRIWVDFLSFAIPSFEIWSCFSAVQPFLHRAVPSFRLDEQNGRSPDMARIRPRRDDKKISTQHIATLLGRVCCERLATPLRRVATCWVLKIVKFFMQHLWMLHNVVVVWADSCNNVAPGHAH